LKHKKKFISILKRLFRTQPIEPRGNQGGSRSTRIGIEKEDRVRAFDGVADASVQSQLTEKKWVWVADKEEGYINGYIEKEDGDNVELHLPNDTVSSKF
jgi:hypothetical protein